MTDRAVTWPTVSLFLTYTQAINCLTTLIEFCTLLLILNYRLNYNYIFVPFFVLQEKKKKKTVLLNINSGDISVTWGVSNDMICSDSCVNLTLVLSYLMRSKHLSSSRSCRQQSGHEDAKSSKPPFNQPWVDVWHSPTYCQISGCITGKLSH